MTDHRAHDVFFSELFGTDPSALAEHGAFDVSLVTDLPLFIDPFLLFNSKNPVYRALHDDVIKYLRFLRDKSLNGPVSSGLLEAWFTFHEVRQNWLGFCRLGNRGSGLGRKFARALASNLNTVFRSFGDETITRGSHLEKLCLITEGVGRDNISDFTTVLIKGHLASYSQDFARSYLAPSQRRVVRLPRVRFNYDTEAWEEGSYELPWFDADHVLGSPGTELEFAL